MKAAAEGDYDYIVVSGFACLDSEGGVKEVEPYVSGELSTRVYKSEVMVDAPVTYRELEERELVALFYTYPCTAWGIGLVMKVLASFQYAEEALKEVHGRLMSPDVWTNSRFNFNVVGDNRDKFEDAFETVATIAADMSMTPAVSKRDLVVRAEETHQSVIQLCIESLQLERKDARKVAVKLMEMRHWCYNQPCGYGSNRQHQMWWWLDMKAGLHEIADSQSWGSWTFGGASSSNDEPPCCHT